MKNFDKRDFFDFSLGRINDIADERRIDDARAFSDWFIKLYFGAETEIKISDGAGDGKVDAFARVSDDSGVRHIVVNSKFTKKYNQIAPPAFYDEIVRFSRAFTDRETRTDYLKTVRASFRQQMERFFEQYDKGNVELIFATNHRANPNQVHSIRNIRVTLLHFDELIRCMIDNAEGAMPRTPNLTLTDISQVLTPPKSESTVATSIVFARIVDFVDYMRTDPLELLFARNIRLNLGNTAINEDIADTYLHNPQEFAFSNNGITLLCEGHKHEPADAQITISNPRVVNGSQTLHSIASTSKRVVDARVMVKIISIAAPSEHLLAADIAERKKVIAKIAIRTNRQNAIKDSDLVTNDDYQHELALFFGKHSYFYERRRGEWQTRKLELQARGIQRGPDMRRLMQISASYLWKTVGPARARSSVQALFRADVYKAVSEVSAQTLYRAWLLNDCLEDFASEIASNGSPHLMSLAKYSNYALLSKTMQLLESSPINIKRLNLAQTIYQNSGNQRIWKSIVKKLLALINNAYKDAAREERKTGTQLTVANYFKSGHHMKGLMSLPLPALLKNEINSLKPQ